MTDQVKQLQQIFPDFPRNSEVINKDGKLTEQWYLGFSSLFQALQKNLKNEGFLIPSLAKDKLDKIEAIYAPYIGFPLPQSVAANRSQLELPDISGQTVFDSTNRLPKQFIITYDNATPPNVLSAQWLILNVMLLHAGNPNGAKAGVLNWFCFDTVGHILYICTTSGSIASAVWTAL